MGEGTSMRAGNKRRVQVRRKRREGFTAKKRQVFFDRLAACCNVARAGRPEGSVQGATLSTSPPLARFRPGGRGFPPLASLNFANFVDFRGWAGRRKSR